MARSTLNLKISLDNVHCYDEGDGWGNAEPYLWPVFFKIDGDNYALESEAGLIGFPVIESRNGHHGNLNNTDVDAGNNVGIPEAIGIWQNTLKPIPINDPFIKSLIGDDLPGIAGVVVVLMEEDSWPDSLADTGYNALVNAVTLAVAKVAAGFQHATHAPTKAEIDEAIKTVKDTAASMVRDAVKSAMSGFQLLWFGTFGNNDDTVGSEAWTFTHDDFATNAVINFSRHWNEDEAGDGDWEISGAATGVAPCPANAFSNLFNMNAAKISPKNAVENSDNTTLSVMRNFREKEFTAFPGLVDWWGAAHKANPEIIRIVAENKELSEKAKRLFNAIPNIFKAIDKPLDNEHWDILTAILLQVAKSSKKLDNDFIRQALSIIPKLKGNTFREALKYVSEIKIITNENEKRKSSKVLTSKEKI